MQTVQARHQLMVRKACAQWSEAACNGHYNCTPDLGKL